MTELAEPVDDGRCIACGPDAPFGLKMQFERLSDDSVESRVVVPAAYQGWRGVVHGGAVAMLLDEAMAYAAAAAGVLGVTAELKMRFRKAVPVGAPLLVRGSVHLRRGKVLGVSASVKAEDGTLLASGEGSFVSRGEIAPGTRFGERFVRRGEA